MLGKYFYVYVCSLANRYKKLSIDTIRISSSHFIDNRNKIKWLFQYWPFSKMSKICDQFPHLPEYQFWVFSRKNTKNHLPTWVLSSPFIDTGNWVIRLLAQSAAKHRRAGRSPSVTICNWPFVGKSVPNWKVTFRSGNWPLPPLCLNRLKVCSRSGAFQTSLTSLHFQLRVSYLAA